MPLKSSDGEPLNYTNDPIGAFDAVVPPAFLAATIEMLFRAYELRERQLARFPEAEKHDLWPHYRRAIVESEWRPIAAEHGLAASPAPNAALNAFHTEISAGLVVLTESFTDQRGYLPRHAEFRQLLTRSCQGVLFPSIELEQPDPSSRIYAILTHSQLGDDPTQPAFADLLFPAIDGKRVVIAESIRLFEDRFAALVAQLRGARMPVAHEPENITDETELRLRDGEETGTQ